MAKTGHSAERYAEDVGAGRIPAAKYVKLAVERYFDDVEHAKDRGLQFNRNHARHALKFFGFLRHSKGEWAGKPFKLSGWQEFIIWNLFGWYRTDGTRRYRVAYIEVPRKSGKSTFGAGIGLYLFHADGEPGPEVYTAATKRDQARIVHSEAVRMVQASPNLRRSVKVYRDNICIPLTAAKYEPLGADADTMDGLNVHGAVIDELHAHKSRAVWDALETATPARRQPLLLAITTAGFDRESICWEQHEYAAKILERVIEDDSYFAFISGAEKDDDWTDPDIWAKANPNLDVSVKRDDLARKCRKAQEMPAAQNAFLRLHLNIWTQNESRWISAEVWDRSAGVVNAPALKGRVSYAGLDLASTTDIAAFVLIFPDDDGSYDVLSSFWVPEDSARERSRKDRVQYDVWIRDGYIEATEGNVTDYDVIRERIRQLAERFDIREIAIDRWNSTQLQTQLDADGFTVVPFGQGFASMGGPTRELEKLLLGGKLRHGGNPVLSWMASNVSVKQDAAGNLKPDKQKSTEKIDGIVALVMALGRAIVRPESERSVYEDRGLLFI